MNISLYTVLLLQRRFFSIYKKEGLSIMSNIISIDKKDSIYKTLVTLTNESDTICPITFKIDNSYINKIKFTARFSNIDSDTAESIIADLLSQYNLQQYQINVQETEHFVFVNTIFQFDIPNSSIILNNDLLDIDEQVDNNTNIQTHSLITKNVNNGLMIQDLHLGNTTAYVSKTKNINKPAATVKRKPGPKVPEVPDHIELSKEQIQAHNELIDDIITKPELVQQLIASSQSLTEQQNQSTTTTKKTKSVAVQLHELLIQASKKMTIQDIQKLCDIKYCKLKASLAYPLFMLVNPYMEYKDQASFNGKKRYARKPILLNNHAYYVCNHVFDNNLKKIKQLFSEELKLI